MAQDLGTAVLRLEVQTQEALQALNLFRAQVAAALKDTDSGSIFNGVEQSARAAGEKAGRALTDGIKKASKELKFGSFQQALDFNPKNSIKGLEDYARALRNLRDKTDLGASGTQRLTDRLGAVEAALRQAKQTTAQTTAEQKRFNDALDKVALQRFTEQSRSFSAALKEQARAAAANAAQFAKLREQAEGAAKAVAGVAAKGAVEAIKVPIFGLPKDVTGTFDKARAQIERLQKQAETASGKVARLSEGIAVLGGGGLAAKGVIDTLGGIGEAAGNTTGVLSQVQQALASLPGPLKGLGGLDDLFSKGAQSVAEWSASILRAQGELTTLSAPLEAVTNSLAALGPEAALVGGALAFTFAGFQDLISKSFKPGIDGARTALKGLTADTQALLESLAAAAEASKGIASLRDLRVGERDAQQRVQDNPAGSEASVEANRELLDIQKRINQELQEQFYQNQRLATSDRERANIAKRLIDAAKPSAQLALPSSQILNAEGRGIRRLVPDLGPAIDVGLQSARNFTKELLNAGKAGEGLPPIFGQVGTSLRGLVELTEEQTQGTKFQNELLQDQLELQQKLRATEEQRSREARARLAQGAERRRNKELAVAEFSAVPIDGRLPGGGFAAGSPGDLAGRRRRLREAGSNALIGGAFPALFGQGLGASVGGAVGGGAGGLVGGQFGFGLSLVGTAVGAQFDAATDKLKTLGTALENPIGQFGSLTEAGLISSRSLEKQIQALIDTGREAEAAALIQKDLANTYGDLQGAQELAAQSDELNRAWTKLQVTVAGLTASPIVELLNSTASALNLFAGAIATIRNAIPEQLKAPVSDFGKELALSVLSPGIKSIIDASKLVSPFFPGQTPASPTATAPSTTGDQTQDSLRQLRLRAITAEVQGNEELTLELRKQTVELEKQEALQNAAARGDSLLRQRQIADEYNSQLQRVNEELTKLSQNNAAAAQRRNAEFDIGVQGIQRQIDAQNLLAQVAEGPYKQYLQQRLGIEEATAAAQDQVNLLGAQLDELRAKGTAVDSDEFVKIVQQQQLAVKQLELVRSQGNNALVNAGNTYRDAVNDASRQAEDSFKQVAQQAESAANSLRSALEGSFNLLTPQLQKNLLNDARRDINQAISAGIFNPGAVALQTGSVQGILDVANRARGIDRANEQLASVNSELVGVNRSLAGVTEKLVQKDWQVNVAVDANTGTSEVQLG